MSNRPKLAALVESANRVTAGVPSWMLDRRDPAPKQTTPSSEDKKIKMD